MAEFTEFELYKGKAKGKFFPVSHQYWVNGTRPKSVTGIIGIKDKSVALIPWALEEGAKHLLECLEKGIKINEEQIIRSVFASDQAKEKAATLGTVIHDWIERYIRFKLKQPGYKTMPEMPENKAEIVGVNSFLEWESQHKVKFVWTEKILYSMKYGYIGKADFAAYIDGELSLCDNKTSNGLYNSVGMQTAAYMMADQEESKAKYVGRWAIRVAKETEAEYYARMELKNKIKKILGKPEKEIKPYQIFEAKFLDAKGTEAKRDFKAFINCLELGQWDGETWKEYL